MTAFILAALALIAATLIFILPPLLRGSAGTSDEDPALQVLRDQYAELRAEHAAGVIDAHVYDQARNELQQRVAQESLAGQDHPALHAGGRRSAWALGMSVPLVAIALYVALGNPLALVPEEVGGGAGAHGPAPVEIEQMVAGLAARLKEQPDHAEGWAMLARSYNAMGRFQDAARAYEQLARLTPNDAAMFADYADTLGMAMGQTLQGKPEQLITRALALDPDNLKALALSGTAAFERGDYARAIKAWERIVAVAPEDSEIAQSTRGSIAAARSRLEGRSASATAPVVPDSMQQGARAEQAAGAGAEGPEGTQSAGRIEGVVDIDPALRARLSGDETVFVFARPAQGPRAPLAVLRRPVKDLPFRFVLDDSMSMLPGHTLSKAGQVVVGARISRDGSANPDASELQVLSAPMAPGKGDLRLVISAPGG